MLRRQLTHARYIPSSLFHSTCCRSYATNFRLKPDAGSSSSLPSSSTPTKGNSRPSSSQGRSSPRGRKSFGLLDDSVANSSQGNGGAAEPVQSQSRGKGKASRGKKSRVVEEDISPPIEFDRPTLPPHVREDGERLPELEKPKPRKARTSILPRAFKPSVFVDPNAASHLADPSLDAHSDPRSTSRAPARSFERPNSSHSRSIPYTSSSSSERYSRPTRERTSSRSSPASFDPSSSFNPFKDDDSSSSHAPRRSSSSPEYQSSRPSTRSSPSPSSSRPSPNAYARPEFGLSHSTIPRPDNRHLREDDPTFDNPVTSGPGRSLPSPDWDRYPKPSPLRSQPHLVPPVSTRFAIAPSGDETVREVGRADAPVYEIRNSRARSREKEPQRPGRQIGRRNEDLQSEEDDALLRGVGALPSLSSGWETFLPKEVEERASPSDHQASSPISSSPPPRRSSGGYEFRPIPGIESSPAKLTRNSQSPQRQQPNFSSPPPTSSLSAPRRSPLAPSAAPVFGQPWSYTPPDEDPSALSSPSSSTDAFAALNSSGSFQPRARGPPSPDNTTAPPWFQSTNASPAQTALADFLARSHHLDAVDLAEIRHLHELNPTVHTVEALGKEFVVPMYEIKRILKGSAFRWRGTTPVDILRSAREDEQRRIDLLNKPKKNDDDSQAGEGEAEKKKERKKRESQLKDAGAEEFGARGEGMRKAVRNSRREDINVDSPFEGGNEELDDYEWEAEGGDAVVEKEYEEFVTLAEKAAKEEGIAEEEEGEEGAQLLDPKRQPYARQISDDDNSPSSGQTPTSYDTQPFSDRQSSHADPSSFTPSSLPSSSESIPSLGTASETAQPAADALPQEDVPEQTFHVIEGSKEQKSEEPKEKKLKPRPMTARRLSRAAKAAAGAAGKKKEGARGG